MNQLTMHIFFQKKLSRAADTNWKPSDVFIFIASIYIWRQVFLEEQFHEL